MSSDLPTPLLPHAEEYERIQRELMYLDAESGRASVIDREAADVLEDADLISRAYIDFTRTPNFGRQDMYFTNMADYLVELCENLNKRRDEKPLVTPPFSRTFKFDEDRPGVGGWLGDAIIYAMEVSLDRIKDLKLVEFVAQTPENAALISRNKETVVSHLKELLDRAYPKDTNDIEGLVELARSAAQQKRNTSISLPLEPGLDLLVWHCHRVELVLDDISDMMDRGSSEKLTQLWRTDTLERCQLASRHCRELKEEVEKYRSDNPDTLLPRRASTMLPEIDPQALMGRNHENLSLTYRNALKAFTDLVSSAVKEVEKRKIIAEVENIVAESLLEVREEQLAAIQDQSSQSLPPTETPQPSVSATDTPEGLGSYSFDDYASLVAELRLKEIRRVSVFSSVWNQRINWRRCRPSNGYPSPDEELVRLGQTTHDKLKKLSLEGWDPQYAPNPLGWWDGAE